MIDAETDAAAIAVGLRIALRDIAAWWDHMIQPGPAARPTGTIGRSPDRVDPVHPHVLDVRRDTVDTLTGWSLLVAEDLDLRPGLDAGDAIGLAGFLEQHLAHLAHHDAATDAHGEITAQARAIYGVVHAGPRAAIVFAGLCPGCRLRLDRPEGEAWLTCPACEHSVHLEKVQEAAFDAARDHVHSPATAELFARTLDLKVSRKTITTWHQRGLIAPVDYVGRTPLYRWSEIETLIGRTA